MSLTPFWFSCREDCITTYFHKRANRDNREEGACTMSHCRSVHVLWLWIEGGTVTEMEMEVKQNLEDMKKAKYYF